MYRADRCGARGLRHDAGMARSFWADNDFLRRQDINLVLDEAQGLEARLGYLTRQVHELQDTLRALMMVMSETGQLDPRAVQLRVEAELAAMRPPPPKDPAHPGKAPPPEVVMCCDRCGKQVSSTHTNITAQGTICDACAATL